MIFLGYIGPERVKSKTMYTTCRFLFFKIMVPSGRFRLFCLQPHAFLPVTPQNPKKLCFAVKFSGEALAEYFCSQVPQAWMAQVH